MSKCDFIQPCVSSKSCVPGCVRNTHFKACRHFIKCLNEWKNLCFQMRTGMLLIPLNISQEKKAFLSGFFFFFYTHDNKYQLKYVHFWMREISLQKYLLFKYKWNQGEWFRCRCIYFIWLYLIMWNPAMMCHLCPIKVNFCVLFF